MSPKTSPFWMVRDDSDRLLGPISTEQVLALIARGEFRGEETVCAHPGGRWMPISAAPEFSDQLLDALAREVQEAGAGKKDARREPSHGSVATEIVPPGSRSFSRTGFGSVAEERSSTRPTGHAQGTSVATGAHGQGLSRIGSGGGPTASGSPPGLELTDLREIERKEKARALQIPILLIVGAALMLAAGFLFSPTKAGGRFHLLAPRAKQPGLAQDRAVAIFARGLKAFEADGFDSYVRAQNDLVQFVEGMPLAPEGYSQLCLTYRELWPYAAQDSRDLKTLTAVVAESRRADPTGAHSAICEITRLLLTGRYPEARGLVDTWVKTTDGAAALLEIQGASDLAAKEFQSARYYFESARRLNPRWLKPYVEEARALVGQREYTGALELLNGVLRANRSHQVARVELGILEHRQFQHEDKAIDLLTTGLSGADRIPRLTESEGWLALAEAYGARKQNSKALSAARKAYSLNPANADARAFIVALGGEREVPGGSADRDDQLFLVDQYMQAGDYLKAQAAAKAAYEQDAKNAIAAMKAAECLWKLSQATDAIEWMKKAIQADSKLTLAYVELSQYYAEQFDYLSATAVLRKAQSLQPRSHEVYRGFAWIELQQKNYKSAIVAAQRALQLYDMDAEAFLIIGKARMGMGEYIEAQKYVGRAVEMDASNADAKSTNAKVIAGLRGVGEGVAYAKQLIVNYPYVTDYRIALAEIYAKDERWQEALDAYNEARSMLGRKQDKRVLIGAGKAFQALGQNTAALDLFLQAAVLDPTDAQAVFLAGGAYAAQNRGPEAITQFKRALRINPRFPLAHAQIGRAELRAGRADAAVEESEFERANNPNLVEPYVLGAEARYALKDYSGCAQEYQKAVGLGYARARTFVDMARCYRLSGSLDSAVSMLRRAESLESGFAELYKEYGAVYHTKCMTEEAAKAYNTYLSLAPGAKDRAAIESARDRAIQGNCDLTDGVNESTPNWGI